MYKPPLRRESRPAVGGQHKTNLTGFSDCFFFQSYLPFACTLWFPICILGGFVHVCVCRDERGILVLFHYFFFRFGCGFFFLICLFHKERKRRCGIGWVGRLGGSGRGGGGETVI